MKHLINIVYKWILVSKWIYESLSITVRTLGLLLKKLYLFPLQWHSEHTVVIIYKHRLNVNWMLPTIIGGVDADFMNTYLWLVLGWVPRSKARDKDLGKGTYWGRKGTRESVQEMRRSIAKTRLQVKSSFSLILQTALVCDWHHHHCFTWELDFCPPCTRQSLSLRCLRGIINWLQVTSCRCPRVILQRMV